MEGSGVFARLRHRPFLAGNGSKLHPVSLPPPLPLLSNGPGSVWFVGLVVRLVGRVSTPSVVPLTLMILRGMRNRVSTRTKAVGQRVELGPIEPDRAVCLSLSRCSRAEYKSLLFFGLWSWTPKEARTVSWTRSFEDLWMTHRSR